MAGASGGGAAAGFFFLVVVGLYFIPTIVAVVRKVPNVGSIVVINVFLGWTLIGWVVALAMAARSAPTPPAGYRP
ncbi:MAG: superinfection immunity protein [Acidimicrobiales bacterium]